MLLLLSRFGHVLLCATPKIAAIKDNEAKYIYLDLHVVNIKYVVTI